MVQIGQKSLSSPQPHGNPKKSMNIWLGLLIQLLNTLPQCYSAIFDSVDPLGDPKISKIGQKWSKITFFITPTLAWFEPDGRAKMFHDTQIDVILTKNKLEATWMTLSDHI